MINATQCGDDVICECDGGCIDSMGESLENDECQAWQLFQPVNLSMTNGHLVMDHLLKAIIVNVGNFGELFGWGMDRNGFNYGVLVENAYTYCFQKLINALVPLYSVVYQIFFGSFFTELSQNFLNFVFEPNRLSIRFALNANIGIEARKSM